MAEYGKIERRIWNSKTFQKLSEDAQRFWLYILTCPHSNMLGLFVLKPGYAIEDLNWPKERLDKALSEVLSIERSTGKEAGLIKYDKDNHLILIKSQFETNPLTNQNHAKGAIKVLQELPNSPLMADLKAIMEPLYKDLYKDLWKALSIAVSNTVSVTVSVTVEEEVGPGATAPPFQIPTDEDISESSIPKVKEYITGLADLLYKEGIFPDAPKFKNTVLKAGDNPRAILHTLIRCYLKKTFDKPGPWAYCEKILQTENANFNEKGEIKEHEARKKEEFDFVQKIARNLKNEKENVK